jgi:hypothetical protein
MSQFDAKLKEEQSKCLVKKICNCLQINFTVFQASSIKGNMASESNIDSYLQLGSFFFLFGATAPSGPGPIHARGF